MTPGTRPAIFQEAAQQLLAVLFCLLDFVDVEAGPGEAEKTSIRREPGNAMILEPAEFPVSTAQAILHLEFPLRLIGQPVGARAGLQVVRVDVIRPAIAQFLLQLAPGEVEPRLVDITAERVLVRFPKKHWRGICHPAETPLAFLQQPGCPVELRHVPAKTEQALLPVPLPRPDPRLDEQADAGFRFQRQGAGLAFPAQHGPQDLLRLRPQLRRVQVDQAHRVEFLQRVAELPGSGRVAEEDSPVGAPDENHVVEGLKESAEVFIASGGFDPALRKRMASGFPGDLCRRNVHCRHHKAGGPPRWAGPISRVAHRLRGLRQGWRVSTGSGDSYPVKLGY